MHNQVEHVAQAFYDAEGNGQSWNQEPEILKEEFRRFAREAVALLQQESGAMSPEMLASNVTDLPLVA